MGRLGGTDQILGTAVAAAQHENVYKVTLFM